MKGLNAQMATVSTTTWAPVIVAIRLPKASANSARGNTRLVADAVKTTKPCGVSGLPVLRGDIAYDTRDVIAAARRHDVRFGITTGRTGPVTAVVSARRAVW